MILSLFIKALKILINVLQSNFGFLLNSILIYILYYFT